MNRVARLVGLFVLLLGLAGCQLPVRWVCETQNLYYDVMRNVMGIDYPLGAAESSRSKYYGLERPGLQDVCAD